MTNSPPSGSSLPESKLVLLDERIQRWVWSKGWTSLRDAQEQAIPALLSGDRDVIIAAATASGKTEAAFLPILSKLAANTGEMGLALYISPLKALINDQWGRLDELCTLLDIPVTPWHGDITQAHKRQFLKQPQGVLLITPESLEALFVRRGPELRRLFGELHYIVVDELHAFIGSDRGKQLQSLMRRIEVLTERRIPRIGLSATLGDMTLAGTFLRAAPSTVNLIVSGASGQDLKVQVRGYEVKGVSASVAPKDSSTEESEVYESMADHLFKVLQGSNNLLFPNSRQKVEYFSDLLRRRCEREGIPNEFWPHHGSLSRDLREEAEQALKSGDRPATAVCTNTLELGVDIGAIRSVAQIGPPPSVAALRQRLGRSGRRPGEAAILRAYVAEQEVRPDSSLSDRLRESLVQTAATIRLLLQGWFEPPRANGLHLSTMVQQVLSMVAERGGVSATEIASTLLVEGPFAPLTAGDLIELLRELGKRELIIQDASSVLLLGRIGERTVNSYDFYAAFASGEEWQIVCDGHALGTLPIESPVFEGMCIIFAGRRWKILAISSDPPVLTVAPDPTGQAPRFDSGRPLVHTRVRQEMRLILEQDSDIAFLDPGATQLLQQARQFYRHARLADRPWIRDGKEVTLLTWSGDFANNALVLLLRSLGLPSASNEGLVVTCEGWELPRLIDACSDIATLPEIDLVALLNDVENMRQGKWDWALPHHLLVRSFASMGLDVAEAKSFAARLVDDGT